MDIESVHDARMLLEYASHRGLEVPADLTTAVLVADSAVQAGAIDHDTERAFWNAMAGLVKLVSPASIDGLKAAATARSSSSWLFGAHLSPAESAVSGFTRMTVLVFVVLAMVQVYALSGDDLIKQLQERRLKRKDVAVEWNSLASKAQRARPPLSQDEADKLARLGADLGVLDNEMVTYNEVLGTWIFPARMPTELLRRLIPGPRAAVAETAGSPPPSEPSARPSARDGQMQPGRPSIADGVKKFDPMQGPILNLWFAGVMVEGFRSFVLPCMYGLLGACFFVLLNLAREIESGAYRALLKYRIRLWLGALAGVAIGWITKDLQGGLTPSAFAFVAGYSVEVLIGTLDRLVEAFAPKGSAAHVRS